MRRLRRGHSSPPAQASLRRRLGRGVALQDGDEEAVGALLCGREAEVTAVGGTGRGVRLLRHGFAPDIGDRQDREIRMLREEGVDLRLVLLRQQRAGGIDQPAARLHQARGAVEDAPLEVEQVFQIVRRQFPPGIGIAAPGADTGAGRIDQHAVIGAGMALHPGIALGAEAAALHIVDARALQPYGRAIDAALQHVAGDDAALVLHRRRHCQGLAAGAGAEIDNAQARPRIHQQGRELRALVLHFDEAVFERRQGRQRRSAIDAQAQGRKRGRLRLDAVARERRHRVIAAALQSIGAQIQGRLRQQGLHLRIQPYRRRYDAGCRRAIREIPAAPIPADLATAVCSLRGPWPWRVRYR